MTTHPDYPYLYEGPCVDGEQTWFCYGTAIPEGATRRLARGGNWFANTRMRNGRGDASPSAIYQVKDVPPPRLPDPEGWQQPDGSIVTLARHLKGRRDLDQWEFFTNGEKWTGGSARYVKTSVVVREAHPDRPMLVHRLPR